MRFNRIYMNEADGDGAASGGSSEDNSLLDEGTPTLSEGEYFLSEGIKGQGDLPEWYKADKYGSIADQAKAYTELEKKFGSFTGSPKDGYQLPEGFDKEDALAQEVIKFGNESNLSQDGFNKLMELAAAQAGVTQEYDQKAELAKLGDNAGQRIKQVEAFLKNKAGGEYEAIRDMVTDANSVLLVESIMKAVQPAPLPIDGVAVEGKATWDDIERELYKKDEHGNLLMSVSREHAMKVERMKKEYGGDRMNERTF